MPLGITWSLEVQNQDAWEHSVFNNFQSRKAQAWGLEEQNEMGLAGISTGSCCDVEMGILFLHVIYPLTTHSES